MKTFVFRLAATALLLGTAFMANAQSPYVGESLNYARLQFGGPARTQGIAGANVALGADFGNLSSNPAGLGLFQKSEVHFSPGVGIGSADASGTGTALTNQKNSFHVASLGGVFTNRRASDDAESDWRGGSFAVGFSRVTDFNTSFQYAGQVADNRSLFQYLREPGRGSFGTAAYQSGINSIDKQYNQGTNPAYSNIDGLAYGAYLSDIRSTRNGTDTLRLLRRTGPISQGETVTTSGSVSQLDFGYGGSYKDRLFVGGAIGIVSSNRRQIRNFSESDAPGAVTLALRDETHTTGTGFNARIGAIYRANDVLRLGASVQTPTFMQLDDTYNTSLTTTFSPALPIAGGQTLSGKAVQTPAGEYAYTLTTPFRANGGVALTLAKLGFITADVEYVGYNQSRLSNQPNNANGDDYTFSAENQGIKAAYRNAVNLRVGAEARLDVFRVRAGYAYYADPYQYAPIDRSQQFYTAGLGLRQKNFFLDVAGVYTAYKQLYSPYAILSGQQPVITVNNTRYTTTVTAGFTF